jgi:uncharacterized protein involved in oxidation of intracellular sulfur
MQKITIIINGAPYGTEAPYNALRLANALLAGKDKAEVSIFLVADAVFAAKKGQEPPEGYYNIGQMVSKAISGGATVRLCGTCSGARAITQEVIVEGATISSMIELARLIKESDKVISF